jgi:uncharacterized protein (DUF305 family)
MNAAPSRRSLIVVCCSALLAAFAGGWVWNVAGQGQQSSSVSFNQSMTTHHAQAVTIALILHERVTDADLRAVARDIVLTQQAQIGAMGAHLDSIGASRAGTGHRMIGMASPSDIAALQTLPADQAARLGIELLIAHHRGGVEMSTGYLSEGLDSFSARLAEGIIAAQQSEIELLGQLATRFDELTTKAPTPSTAREGD